MFIGPPCDIDHDRKLSKRPLWLAGKGDRWLYVALVLEYNPPELVLGLVKEASDQAGRPLPYTTRRTGVAQRLNPPYLGWLQAYCAAS